MSVECKWCDTVVDVDFSVGDTVIYTDDDGKEIPVILRGMTCGPCQDKFGEVSNK